MALQMSWWTFGAGLVVTGLMGVSGASAESKTVHLQAPIRNGDLGNSAITMRQVLTNTMRASVPGDYRTQTTFPMNARLPDGTQIEVTYVYPADLPKGLQRFLRVLCTGDPEVVTSACDELLRRIAPQDKE